MPQRTYFDWNASTPLCPPARAAMLAAMECVGNPSSIHTEGRAARALVERARHNVAQAIGSPSDSVVFTSGATEAAALACTGRNLIGSNIEHACVRAWIHAQLHADASGVVTVPTPQNSVLQAANGETGVIQSLPRGLAVSDLTQMFGKCALDFSALDITMGFISAHKLGGPKGVGALLVSAAARDALTPCLQGGGQEHTMRAGTENIIGIAGFAAAALDAVQAVRAGVWQQLAEQRDALEAALANACRDIVFVGQNSPRLPNTSCFIVPKWTNTHQLMHMDLAGFAISAGSACASGQTEASPVLRAMGYSADMARCAVRVSFAPWTKKQDIVRFVTAWTQAYKKRK